MAGYAGSFTFAFEEGHKHAARLAELNRLSHVNQDRPALVHGLIESYGLLLECAAEEAQPASLEQLLQYHSREYLAALAHWACLPQPQLAAFGLEDDCAPFPGLYELAALTAGGSLQAAAGLCSGKHRLAVHLDGGRHHAHKSRAAGFCHVNDVVLAVLQLLGSWQRVLYLDLDVHHGDAVEEAFLLSSRVLTVSMHKHAPGFFPGTGGGSSGSGAGRGFALNLPLADGTRDELFVAAFSELAGGAVAAYDPGCIVLQCGVDGLAFDPLAASWGLTPAAYESCARLAASWGRPLLLLGGGGYHSPSAAVTWAKVLVALMGRQLPEDIPEHDHFPQYGPAFTLASVTKRLLPRDTSSAPEVMAACRRLLGELREAVARTLGGRSAIPADSGPGYSCSGPLPSRVQPGLEVEGVGRISLPLTDEKALELKATCSLAPFGRGTETVVDTAVRNTFQLTPQQFRLTNPRWESDVIPEAVQVVKAALGIAPNKVVEAQLYRLLLYEPGSHFARHRDTEKAPGMFGTLTITLPSAYKGGEIVVRHNGLQTTMDLARLNLKKSCFAAFFADCEHEILPVTSGHRLTLVYNLCSRGTSPAPPVVPTDSVRRLVAVARQWGSRSGQAPLKVCYMLAHRYTEDSLQQHGLEAFKPEDRATAQLVLEACSVGAELDAALCLVEREVEGDYTADVDEALCGCVDDEADMARTEPDAVGDYRAHKWVALAGPTPAFGSLPLQPSSELIHKAGYWAGRADEGE
ncbi:hypothetical protein D9Q98_010533 [Chlorella vulgaris]|uniref:histone deacetylase n=1 Tax=Chlorella vulgaris TaxID=3077 RepID=A0A9D4YXT7_CHLVU|nr:hypothetical protein D9Q98_010533 [Chlorella vulgaris]